MMSRVWLITLRDLQWRRRRFVLAVIAAGLAFSLALVMNGTMQHFGELAPLYGLRRSATARAVVPSRVVGYSGTEFRQMRHELADA